jgi:hypothetical protein
MKNLSLTALQLVETIAAQNGIFKKALEGF